MSLTEAELRTRAWIGGALHYKARDALELGALPAWWREAEHSDAIQRAVRNYGIDRELSPELEALAMTLWLALTVAGPASGAERRKELRAFGAPLARVLKVLEAPSSTLEDVLWDAHSEEVPEGTVVTFDNSLTEGLITALRSVRDRVAAAKIPASPRGLTTRSTSLLINPLVDAVLDRHPSTPQPALAKIAEAVFAPVIDAANDLLSGAEVRHSSRRSTRKSRDGRMTKLSGSRDGRPIAHPDYADRVKGAIKNIEAREATLAADATVGITLAKRPRSGCP